MKRIIAIPFLMLMFLTSCYYDNEETLYPNKHSTSNTIDTSVSYSATIAPMIKDNCATSGCHVTGATFPDLSNYSSLVANIGRVQVRAIDEKTMPAAAPMSDANIQKLQSWINAGTPNN